MADIEPKQDTETDKNNSSSRLIQVAGVIVVLIIVILGFVATSSSEDSSQTESTLSSSGSIPTSEIVRTLKDSLGVDIDQRDFSRGITFTHLSKKVDFWSAPYVTLIIYPDANQMQADDSNFQDDFSTWNSDRTWESCDNFIVVYPERLSGQVANAISHWCKLPSPTPTESPANTDTLKPSDGFTSTDSVAPTEDPSATPEDTSSADVNA